MKPAKSPLIQIVNVAPEEDSLHQVYKVRVSLPSVFSKKRALELSILKWQTIVDFVRGRKLESFVLYEDGADTCALCAKYQKYECVGCPVSKETGWPFCRDTAYVVASRTLKSTANGGIKGVEAQRELSFLKRLYRKLYSVSA